MTPRSLAAVALVALAAAPVHAEPSAPAPAGSPASGADRWRTSSLSVSAHLGAATPYGWYGFELEVSPLPWLAVAVGTGRGVAGQQAAGALRIRHVRGASAVGLSAGVGRGDTKVTTRVGWTSVSRRVFDVTWLNDEVYYEHRFAGGALLRGYVGSTYALDFGGCVKEDGELGCGPEEIILFAVAGVALGVHF